MAVEATRVEGEAISLPPALFVGLDRLAPSPLYFQVASRLEDAILSGELAPGSKIENEISLSERLGLSRPTVRRAIQELVDKGLLVRRRGIGTQVVSGKPTRKMGLDGLYDDLDHDGRRPSTELLERSVVGAREDIARRLGCAQGESILYLRRLRLSGGAPVALMENFLPVRFDFISNSDLVEHGLYQLMRASGAAISVARQTIGARKPTVEERKALHMGASEPVLTMDRVAFDNAGVAIDVGAHLYRPDLYNIEVTIVGR